MLDPARHAGQHLLAWFFHGVRIAQAIGSVLSSIWLMMVSFGKGGAQSCSDWAPEFGRAAPNTGSSPRASIGRVSKVPLPSMDGPSDQRPCGSSVPSIWKPRKA